LKQTMNWIFFQDGRVEKLVSPIGWLLWTITLSVSVNQMIWFSSKGLVSPTSWCMQTLLQIGVCFNLVLTIFINKLLWFLPFEFPW
jgi:hypothetical protein